MVKRILKWSLISLAVLLALLLVLALVLTFFHLPRYLIGDERVELAEEDTGEITLMSTNVRCYAPLDLFEKSWFYRAELIVEDINKVQPDIVGFQEATFMHYDYLKKVMQGYDSEIYYRDDFVLSEGCPIFYRRDKFVRVESGSFWLSSTPDVMSKDWGAAHYRVANYVVLRSRADGSEFVVFNTHLDHVSDEARINGIGVVLEKIAELGDLPAFLMGDMNDTPESETIKSTRVSFDDAHDIADVADEGATYHNWGVSPERERIDYILISKGDAEVSRYGIVDNCYDGAWSSDHSSIYVRARLIG